MMRVMGSGSFDSARRGGGTKPFIGPSFTRAEHSAVLDGAPARPDVPVGPAAAEAARACTAHSGRGG